MILKIHCFDQKKSTMRKKQAPEDHKYFFSRIDIKETQNPLDLKDIT